MSKVNIIECYEENGLYDKMVLPCNNIESAKEKKNDFPNSKIFFDCTTRECTVFTPKENLEKIDLLQALSENLLIEMQHISKMQERQLDCIRIIRNIVVASFSISVACAAIYLLTLVF